MGLLKEHETTAEERQVSQNINNMINQERLNGGLKELQFCSVFQNIAFGLAKDVQREKPKNLSYLEGLIGVLGLERDTFSI